MKTLLPRTTGSLHLIPALLLTAALPGPVHADDSQRQPYAMTVLADKAHGKRVLAGSYQSAIDRISAKPLRPRTAFERQTNLCVAYTKARQLQRAISACDAAVQALEEKQHFYAKRRFANETGRRAFFSDLSIALSNRGVLFIVNGEIDKARESFIAATELEYDRSMASRNLQLLDSTKS